MQWIVFHNLSKKIQANSKKVGLIQKQENYDTSNYFIILDLS